nr:hypothetical protein [Streptomyces sp. CB00455]
MNTELTVLQQDKAVGQDDTIRMLLGESKRYSRAVPIRRAFIQDADPGPRLVTRPGPFPKLLRSPGRLDLLLLIHCVAAHAEWGVTRRSETWGRAAGISFATDGTASAAVSRHLAKLKDLKLISTAPDGRMTRITKLLEDGSGNPYTRPSGNAEGSRKDIYFKVPFAYWEQGYYRSLDMPAKAIEAWEKISCGDGAKGPRVYHWAAVRLPAVEEFDYQGEVPYRMRWALARRSIRRPDEIAYYLAYAPLETTVQELVRMSNQDLWIGLGEGASRDAKSVPSRVIDCWSPSRPALQRGPGRPARAQRSQRRRNHRERLLDGRDRPRGCEADACRRPGS